MQSFADVFITKEMAERESLDATIFENIAFWLEKACFVMAIYMSCYRIYV